MYLNWKSTFLFFHYRAENPTINIMDHRVLLRTIVGEDKKDYHFVIVCIVQLDWD
jgi:hypothetical protein